MTIYQYRFVILPVSDMFHGENWTVKMFPLDFKRTPVKPVIVTKQPVAVSCVSVASLRIYVNKTSIALFQIGVSDG